MTGIYQIQSNIKPERIYIGSSVNIRVRWNKHLTDLRLNKNSSPKMQYHYNKYGQSDLVFSILLICDKIDLLKREQEYIDKFNPYFNIYKIAGSPLGSKRTDEMKKNISKIMTGKHHTEDTKQKMRDNHRGMTGKRQSAESNRKNSIKNKGRVFSLEHRMKLSKAKLQWWTDRGYYLK